MTNHVKYVMNYVSVVCVRVCVCVCILTWLTTLHYFEHIINLLSRFAGQLGLEEA